MAKSNQQLSNSSMDLFQSMPGSPRSNPMHLKLRDAEIEYYQTFFDKPKSDGYFEHLLANAVWTQEKIKYYGKLFDLPRLTAWYGDSGKSYTYSGITVNALPWSPALLAIKNEIEAVSNVVFNCVLLNLYRSERDSVSWHSDDEPELGENPIIGSVSFGDVRTFHFRHKEDDSLRSKIELEHGSYLLMKGATQRYWQHQISKSTRHSGPRINLTFRKIA